MHLEAGFEGEERGGMLYRLKKTVTTLGGGWAKEKEQEPKKTGHPGTGEGGGHGGPKVIGRVMMS